MCISLANKNFMALVFERATIRTSDVNMVYQNCKNLGYAILCVEQDNSRFMQSSGNRNFRQDVKPLEYDKTAEILLQNKDLLRKKRICALLRNRSY